MIRLSGQHLPASKLVPYDGRPASVQIYYSSMEIDWIGKVVRDRTDAYKIEPSFIDSQSLVRAFNVFTKFCVWETEYRFGGWRPANDFLR